jgi:hypothetical protein
VLGIAITTVVLPVLTFVDGGKNISQKPSDSLLETGAVYRKMIMNDEFGSTKEMPEVCPKYIAKFIWE